MFLLNISGLVANEQRARLRQADETVLATKWGLETTLRAGIIRDIANDKSIIRSEIR